MFHERFKCLFFGQRLFKHFFGHKSGVHYLFHHRYFFLVNKEASEVTFSKLRIYGVHFLFTEIHFLTSVRVLSGYVRFRIFWAILQANNEGYEIATDSY